MKHISSAIVLGVAACSLAAQAAPAQDVNSSGKIKHVLLLSIDGMHAVDYKNCSEGIDTANSGEPYCPALAALGKTAANYVAASTSKPSDSFPGLMSIVSGATPRTMGIYYDVAYDRSLAPPAETTGNGLAGGSCIPYGNARGTTTEYEEGSDINQNLLNGGSPGASLTDGGIGSLEPKRLVRNPAAGCAPVYPWDFVRVNTIFGVIHAAGGYTAWSDKHPAYSAVQGPGGNSLDDFYAPEINSAVVAVPGITTPLGENCEHIQDSRQTGSWTNSFQNIRCNDSIKVKAILNQIYSKSHLGTSERPVPTLFGMNFQAVSVGQKLIEKEVGTGGYKDAKGTPSSELIKEIEFVDDSVAQMVQELKDRGLYESTLIVITAKHGQSPIDPNKYFPIPGPSGNNGTSPATLIAPLLPPSESPLNPTGIGATEDDISLLWLADSGSTESAVATLEKNLTVAGIGEIFFGNARALNYNKPGTGAGEDPRTPDIIITPNIGVTYTGSSKKLSEHGGFAHDDTNVLLLVSNPALASTTVHAAVETDQVAPTILKSLGLDPTKLDAVRKEGTAVLPHLDFSSLEQ